MHALRYAATGILTLSTRSEKLFSLATVDEGGREAEGGGAAGGVLRGTRGRARGEERLAGHNDSPSISMAPFTAKKAGERRGLLSPRSYRSGGGFVQQCSLERRGFNAGHLGSATAGAGREPCRVRGLACTRRKWEHCVRQYQVRCAKPVRRVSLLQALEQALEPLTPLYANSLTQA